MANKKLKDFIIPTKLYVHDENGKVDPDLTTNDYVFIATAEELEINNKIGKFKSYKISATDFAICSGATIRDDSAEIFVRDAGHEEDVMCYYNNEVLPTSSSSDRDLSIRPSMRLDATKLIQAGYNFSFQDATDKNNDRYKTMQFGEYPQKLVDSPFCITLETLYKGKKLKETGKTYFKPLAPWEFDGGEDSPEFEYNGKKYVRALVDITSDTAMETALGLDDGEFAWFEVEPIMWKIMNWRNLPNQINPKGNGSDNFIELRSMHALIAGIPYNYALFEFHDFEDECAFEEEEGTNQCMWQNSAVRAYLNGYDLDKEFAKGNGDGHYCLNDLSILSIMNNFINKGFINEAFSETLDLSLNKTKNNQSSKRMNQNGEWITREEQFEKEAEKTVNKSKRKGYGVQIQTAPLTVSEQIKFYINNGKSFMLHGPSGVGKTRRIEEADPDFVSIVLRNGILPEEVIGKTIYPNNDATKSGVWVPPAWYASLCDKCEKEPDKNHVLFIDEITNVKPNEQSLVFHLVLNNSIGPNIGKLPDNVVVVAAGNSKEESEAAYNMPEPLFRRFEGHIELTPNVAQWLEWGSEPSLKHPGRPKVHPLVSAFVATYGDKVFYSAYDSEEPPKFAIDPRGWEQISDIIYSNKGVIAKELIENKVGENIAASFMAFAKNPPLMLEDVLENNYDFMDIPSSFDERYAMALSLRHANEQQIPQVRKFIEKELGAEIASMFDSVWVGDNNERAMLVNELQQQEQKELKQQETKKNKQNKTKNQSSKINTKTNSAGKTNSSGTKTFTLDQFIDRDRKTLGIACNHEWQAKLICEALHNKGETWVTGESYLVNPVWENEGVVYYNNGTYTSIEESADCDIDVLYDFYDVDLSKYLSKEAIDHIKTMRKIEELTKNSANKPATSSYYWGMKEYLDEFLDEYEDK